MKRVGVIGALILTSITAATVLFPYVNHFWQVSPLYGIPILWAIIFSAFWGFAIIYERRWNMSQYEWRSDMMLSPYNIDHFSPWEEMCFTNFHLANMEANYIILKELGATKAAAKIKTQIKMVKGWMKLGYIQLEDFPKHLEPWIKKRKQTRL